MNSQEEYNKQPVHYCARCLSLKVLRWSPKLNASYCGDCGNTVIPVLRYHEGEGIYPIEIWQDMYEDMYDKPYVVKSKFAKYDPERKS
jgi:hypothetical protein